MTDEDVQPDMTAFLAEAVAENRRILGLPPQSPERYLDREDRAAMETLIDVTYQATLHAHDPEQLEFKVGDRVEVLEPADGLFSGEANNIGLGSVVRVDEHGQLEIKVDDNDRAWWYEAHKVRHAVEEVEIHPTPSITVGTQVRLTGVVVSEGPDADGDYAFRIKGMPPDANTYLRAECLPFLEVIRQPFKRGEVVYNRDDSEPEPFVVLNDESDGAVDLTNCRTGSFSEADNPEAFERRPSRPKEKR